MWKVIKCNCTTANFRVNDIDRFCFCVCGNMPIQIDLLFVTCPFSDLFVQFFQLTMKTLDCWKSWTWQWIRFLHRTSWITHTDTLQHSIYMAWWMLLVRSAAWPLGGNQPTHANRRWLIDFHCENLFAKATFVSLLQRQTFPCAYGANERFGKVGKARTTGFIWLV